MTETKRLYFDNAYLVEFEARVVASREFEGRPALVLDQTAFYPEAGGQPCDAGTINGIEVFKVVEEGETILHAVGDRIEAGHVVHGKIDWPKRFDRMQQHSGQHVLSQAFYEILKGETLAFHLGDEVSTIEIGIQKITDEELDRIENRANSIVFQNLEVKTYFVDEERIGTIPLRRPPKKEGLIRVVEVSDFDYSACGGTHCRRAGEIGLIKVTKWERIRGHLRFDFVCGGRALKDDQEKTRIVRQLTAAFSVSDKDIAASVEKALAEVKILKKKARRLEERIAVYEAQEAIRGAQGKVIRAVFEDKSAEEARFLALQIIKQAELVILYAAPQREDQSRIILAASEGLGLDVRQLIPVLTSVLEAKGGGSSSLVELVTRDNDKIPQALAAAESFVKGKL